MREGLLFLKIPRALSVLALSAAFGASAAGCVVEADRCDGCGGGMMGGYSGSAGAPAPGPVSLAQIDTGQTLSTPAGEGAGVIIEYNEGGNWHVYTACDSNLYGQGCAWDVVASVSPGQFITNPTIESPEAADGDAIYPTMDSVKLVVDTWADIDGMRFNTTPGTTVRFDVYLGGIRDARYIYWVGNDAIHKGAPTDPIDLRPSTP